MAWLWKSAHLLCLLLELLDGPLVDATALVDEMAGGGRLAGVDMTDDHDVDVNFILFPTHCWFCWLLMSNTEIMRQ